MLARDINGGKPCRATSSRIALIADAEHVGLFRRNASKRASLVARSIVVY